MFNSLSMVGSAALGWSNGLLGFVPGYRWIAGSTDGDSDGIIGGIGKFAGRAWRGTRHLAGAMAADAAMLLVALIYAIVVANVVFMLFWAYYLLFVPKASQTLPVNLKYPTHPNACSGPELAQYYLQDQPDHPRLPPGAGNYPMALEPEPEEGSYAEGGSKSSSSKVSRDTGSAESWSGTGTAYRDAAPTIGNAAWGNVSIEHLNLKGVRPEVELVLELLPPSELFSQQAAHAWPVLDCTLQFLTPEGFQLDERSNQIVVSHSHWAVRLWSAVMWGPLIATGLASESIDQVVIPLLEIPIPQDVWEDAAIAHVVLRPPHPVKKAELRIEARARGFGRLAQRHPWLCCLLLVSITSGVTYFLAAAPVVFQLLRRAIERAAPLTKPLASIGRPPSMTAIASTDSNSNNANSNNDNNNSNNNNGNSNSRNGNAPRAIADKSPQPGGAQLMIRTPSTIDTDAKEGDDTYWRASAVAVSAATGCAMVGTGGAVAGLGTGGTVGAVAGLVGAPLTLGLSIPIGAVLGGGAGAVAGATMAGAAGLVAGGCAGDVCYKRRRDLQWGAEEAAHYAAEVAAAARSGASDAAHQVLAFFGAVVDPSSNKNGASAESNIKVQPDNPQQ